MRRATSTQVAADRQLIALVRKFPALYDTEDSQYQDTVYKGAVWRQIADDIGMDAKLCRSRWFNMRDNHRKSLIRNQMKRRMGQTARVYKYARDMNFLNKYFSNMTHEDQLSDTQNEEDDSRAACPGPATSSPRAKRERSESPHSFLAMEMPVRAEPFLTHPVDAFLACIEPTLKTLPPYLLSLAKGEIFATVQKYELRMYNPTGGAHLSSSEANSQLPDQKYELRMIDPTEGAHVSTSDAKTELSNQRDHATRSS